MMQEAVCTHPCSIRGRQAGWLDDVAFLGCMGHGQPDPEALICNDFFNQKVSLPTVFHSSQRPCPQDYACRVTCLCAGL